LPSISEQRKSLKAIRSAIPDDLQKLASEQACLQLSAFIEATSYKSIAAYFACKGELDPMPFLLLAHSLGKKCYLPVLHTEKEPTLHFAAWTPDSKMPKNEFGIPEPVYSSDTGIAPYALDIVIVPLLGFNHLGHRLGMGGGFYDRCFSFKQKSDALLTPKLIGFAHEAQRCNSLEKMPWDVKMDAIVTPQRIYKNK